jgi:hypothetical protein
MKYFIAFLLSGAVLLAPIRSFAKKHRDRGLPRTEVGLMNNVLGCLANKDSTSYFYLFPPFDTLWSFVIHNPDHTPETMKALNSLKEHPQSLLEFDPYYNHNIMMRFYNVLRKGEDSGIHWKDIVMERYELYKEQPSLALAGYEKIAPERFNGYMFVRDLLGRLTFCITITEIQKINGYFFGGQVINILEASTIDQYMAKEQEENRYFDQLAKNKKNDTTAVDGAVLSDSAIAQKDSINKADNLLRDSIINDDDKPETRKEVIDRKYYEGKFDNEIDVKLYVRYMKDPRGAKLMAYDGLYKFGDQVSYVKLLITKTPDGKWEMEDDLPLGSMELKLENKVYKGTWLNNASQTGYDVALQQTDISEKRMELLDKILEKGLSGRADEDSEDEKTKKKDKDSDDPDEDEEKPKEKKKPEPQQDEGY